MGLLTLAVLILVISVTHRQMAVWAMCLNEDNRLCWEVQQVVSWLIVYYSVNGIDGLPQLSYNCKAVFSSHPFVTRTCVQYWLNWASPPSVLLYLLKQDKHVFVIPTLVSVIKIKRCV